MITYICPLRWVNLAAWPLGASICFFFLLGWRHDRWVLYSICLFGLASVRIPLGLTAGWCYLTALYVRGARQPS